MSDGFALYSESLRGELRLSFSYGDHVLNFTSLDDTCTNVNVVSSNASNIEKVFEVFEDSSMQIKIKRDRSEKRCSPIVFIGHGRSTQWRDLRDHLRDHHKIAVECYESGARAGHAIRDILEEMAQKSSFALLVLTGEDEQGDGQFRARQNVIHEAGLFQGRLGFHRAIILLEEGVEHLSNLDGVQYINFSQNNIRETFGDVVATIRREFPSF